MRLPRTNTAPSCNGEYGRNTLTNRSADTSASTGTPSSAYWRRPAERSITMRAPIRRAVSDSTASTISSMTCARSAREAPNTLASTRPSPIRASARRISGWKSTTRAMTQKDQKLSRIHCVL